MAGSRPGQPRDPDRSPSGVIRGHPAERLRTSGSLALPHARLEAWARSGPRRGHPANRLPASGSFVSAREAMLRVRARSGVPRNDPTNRLLTSGSLASAPHAMLGVCARGPETVRRSDSHHSLRHDCTLRESGKQGINELPATSGVSREAAVIASVDCRALGAARCCGYQATDPGLAGGARARPAPCPRRSAAQNQRRSSVTPDDARSASVAGPVGERRDLPPCGGCSGIASAERRADV